MGGCRSRNPEARVGGAAGCHQPSRYLKTATSKGAPTTAAMPVSTHNAPRMPAISLPRAACSSAFERCFGSAQHDRPPCQPHPTPCALAGTLDTSLRWYDEVAFAFERCFGSAQHDRPPCQPHPTPCALAGTLDTSLRWYDEVAFVRALRQGVRVARPRDASAPLSMTGPLAPAPPRIRRALTLTLSLRRGDHDPPLPSQTASHRGMAAQPYPTSSAAEAPAILPKTEPCMRPAPPA